jgi:hypothetical protein
MKHTILFLAANPIGTDQRALDREARAIQSELERSGFRDSFELETRWAAEPLDLLRELRKLKPTVVHFSGCGSPGDGAAEHGLFFQGADGRPQLVSTRALEDTFGAAGSSVKLVVLTACYSEPQAAALLAHVDCVVGIRGSVRDDAARSFAIGFYGGLGEREPVAAAYRQGCAAIALEGARDADRPELQTRPGVDAERLILASAPAAGGPGWHDGPARVPHRTEAAAMTRDELLIRLSSLLPSQFEEVLFRARIPIAHLSGASAPQATRAIELLRYVEPQDRLGELAAIVQGISAVPR